MIKNDIYTKKQWCCNCIFNNKVILIERILIEIHGLIIKKLRKNCDLPSPSDMLPLSSDDLASPTDKLSSPSEEEIVMKVFINRDCVQFHLVKQRLVMCNKKSSSVKTEELFVGLLGFEPRITGPESVVLPLHHSPNLCCQIPPLEFDGAKISLFLKPAKKTTSFFFHKLPKTAWLGT